MTDFAGGLGADEIRQRRRTLREVLLHRFCSRMPCGSLNVVFPDGKCFRHRSGVPGPDATMVMHRWRALRRLVMHGDLGFAESYIDGDWSSPDLPALIEIAARCAIVLEPAIAGMLLRRLADRLRHLMRANTRRGSRRNIVRHYDLGNDFYRLWLDAGMSYSSALYRDPAMSLEAAQDAKLDRVAEMLAPEPGQSVLEIGCGWGGMAEKLGRRGCQVTGVTLSQEQLRYAVERIVAAHLSQRVELRLQDYREIAGRFDRIVSIEMLEAVGESYWPAYFGVLRDRLKPGGIAVLQVITIADDRFDYYRRKPDFIQRHIFPGGMLPSPAAMRSEIARAGLAIRRVETFGESYALTLRAWRSRFQAEWPAISAMGFSERFQRMWDYYLCYCEAGFRAGAVDVGVWQLENPE